MIIGPQTNVNTLLRKRGIFMQLSKKGRTCKDKDEKKRKVELKSFVHVVYWSTFIYI